MIHRSTVHEVLIAVFQVRTFTAGQSPELGVLLWQRALEPELGSWSLPGGVLESDEDLPSSARRQLAEKVDVRKVAHLEQLSIFSDPDRVPGDRRIASTFLGLVPISTDPK
ncbi:MAG: NUDIX domain-containing protein, partial [Rhodococcus sp. (in: high G+C Gram-positive bacteria)]